MEYSLILIDIFIYNELQKLHLIQLYNHLELYLSKIMVCKFFSSLFIFWHFLITSGASNLNCIKLCNSPTLSTEKKVQNS